MDSRYEIRVSDGIYDPDWDSFVATLPCAPYAQTSLWAQVRALLGWRTVRTILSDEGRIVAGAQLLLRPVPFLGAFGCVIKGPVFASNDHVLVKLVLDELHRLSEVLKIRYLTIQPPGGNENLERELPCRGFRPGSLLLRPMYISTMLIDLRQDLDLILAKMKLKMRHNIRVGGAKYPGSREGTERDVDTFCRLLQETSKRQGFIPDSREYVHKMWEVLGAQGHIKLFLTEYDGEPVASMMPIAFGDTVTVWRACWSGRYGNRHPNETLHWTAIQWAKSQGYHYYDLGGIDPWSARAILYGEPLPEWINTAAGVTPFKLNFGGQVVISPEAYEYAKNMIVRWGLSKVLPRLAGWRLAGKAVQFLRRR